MDRADDGAPSVAGTCGGRGGRGEALKGVACGCYDRSLLEMPLSGGLSRRCRYDDADTPKAREAVRLSGASRLSHGELHAEVAKGSRLLPRLSLMGCNIINPDGRFLGSSRIGVCHWALAKGVAGGFCKLTHARAARP